MKVLSTPFQLFLSLLLLVSMNVFAQVDDDQLGAWYTWFYNRNIDDTPWATQMIIQQRNWDIGRDLQQRFILGQVSYKPENHPLRYGLGYYHLRHGEFGESKSTRDEHVLFQQGIYSTLWGEKNFMTFRLRLEEHWPEQRNSFRNLRTYISLNRPLNQSTLDNKAWYLSVYDEYFINLNTVNYGLNRVYVGLGYKVTEHTSWQFGVMRQNSSSYGKNQLMFNLFHHY